MATRASRRWAIGIGAAVVAATIALVLLRERPADDGHVVAASPPKTVDSGRLAAAPVQLAPVARRAPTEMGVPKAGPDVAMAEEPKPAAAPIDPETARRGLAVLLEERAKVLLLLAQMVEAYEAGRVPEALERARSALAIEPDNREARVFLDEDARSPAPHLRAWLDDVRADPGIDLQLLKWPSLSFWKEAAPLREIWNSAKTRGGDDFIRSVVASTLVTITADDESLASVLLRLQNLTAVEIGYRGSAAQRAASFVVRHLDMREQPLSAVLDGLTSETEFVWAVDHRRVRVSVRGDAAGGAPSASLRLAYYDVSDLLAPVGSSVSGAPSSVAFASIDALVAAVRKEVDAASWADGTKQFVNSQGQTLLVKATQDVHEDVHDWLMARRQPREPNARAAAPLPAPAGGPILVPPPPGSPPGMPPTYVEPSKPQTPPR